MQVIKRVAEEKVCAFYSLLFFTSLIPDALAATPAQLDKNKNKAMMKLKYLLLSVLFVNVGLHTNAQTEKRTAFFPLAVGNYWIYSNTVRYHPFDTLKIIGTKIIQGDTVFLYSNGQMMVQ